MKMGIAPRGLPILVLLVAASSAAVVAQDNVPRAGVWSGVVITNACTADEAFAEDAKCTDPKSSAWLVLFDDTTRRIFRLDPPTAAAGHLGDSVTVRGTLEADTIRVSSLEPFRSIGLAVGQRAPTISARDQFGRQQTLASLRGPKGTVLLFFRSADW
jgi:hypothetical protein